MSDYFKKQKDKFVNHMNETMEYFGIGQSSKNSKKGGGSKKSKKLQMDSAEEQKFDELPEGLKKDTTTGFGANITVEGKSMGGEIEVGKGKDYIKDLIK